MDKEIMILKYNEWLKKNGPLEYFRNKRMVTCILNAEYIFDINNKTLKGMFYSGFYDKRYHRIKINLNRTEYKLLCVLTTEIEFIKIK
jgi:hypothetical protein